MKTKVVNAGRVRGLSSYELAVKNGTFVGTEEEYIQKETATYNDMKNYADDSKTEMNRIIAGLTDASQTDMSEVIVARGSYNTLGDRLIASDDEVAVILNRLANLDAGGEILDDAIIDDEGYLVIRVKDNYEDAVYGNIELRNTGNQIQWRSTGFRSWQTLIRNIDLMPKINNLFVNSVPNDQEATGTITSEGGIQTLTLNIPKGKDGKNGGEIIDAEVNNAGELILTISNYDYVVVDPNNLINGVPILRIGDVKTVGYNENASATITGTPTNPILNLNIPRPKPTKLTRAYVGDDGFLVFDYDEKDEGV